MARAWFAIALAGCGGGSGGGGECGPDIATGVMTATDADDTVALELDNFVALPADQCPDPAAPEGTISLTIRGSHVESGGAFVICVPRPDRLQATGHAGAGEIELSGFEATQDGCSFEPSPGAGGFGGLDVGGFCDGGADPAGFRMSTSIQISTRRDCAGTVTTVQLLFAGTVEVAVE